MKTWERLEEPAQVVTGGRVELCHGGFLSRPSPSSSDESTAGLLLADVCGCNMFTSDRDYAGDAAPYTCEAWPLASVSA